MKQTIETRRLYPVGPYKNVTFSDIIFDVPEELIFDSEAQGLLRLLQFARMEKCYFKYVELGQKVHELGIEDALVLLDGFEKDVMTSLGEVLKNGSMLKYKENLEE
jgi:hypothetical protein